MWLATTSMRLEHRWPTWTAILLIVAWVGVLALAIWIGSNGARPVAAWFVAYPTFALYPWFVAYVAVRAQSGTAIIAAGALTGTLAMTSALMSNAVYQGARGVVDSRPLYAATSLIFGLGLLVGMRVGARIMRGRDRTLLGALAASGVFLATTVVAFAPMFNVTT